MTPTLARPTRLREGQQLKPIEFSALKGQYQKAYNDQLAREKAGLETQKTKAEIAEYNAQALYRTRQAARADKADKQGQAYSGALTHWTKAYDDLTKTNPSATHQDAFNKLPPGEQLAISNGLRAQSDSLEREIKDALSQYPPDQQRANDAKEDQEAIRTMLRTAVGAGATQSALPKAPKPGAHAPQDVVDQYIAKYPTAQAVKDAMTAAGWDTSTATPPKTGAETRAAMSKAIQDRRDAVKGFGKAAINQLVGAPVLP